MRESSTCPQALKPQRDSDRDRQIGRKTETDTDERE